MYVKTLKLERDALKDFREEERALETLENKHWWNETLPFELYDLDEHSNKIADVEMYEGGGR
jgi:hypothetical protein